MICIISASACLYAHAVKMMSVIFFSILSAILGFLLLIFDFVFVHAPKKQEGIEVITDATTGKRRKRIFEGAFDHGTHDDIYCFGQALISRVVFIESQVPLDKSVLMEGLVSMAKIHPLLRMKCEWECSKGKTYRYLSEMDNLTTNELLYSEINKERDNWKDVLENELLKGLNLSMGPLWRVTRMKEMFDSTSNTYKNTVLFTFHHSICDGVSIFNFLDKLLEIIDKLFYGDLLDKNLEPLPLLEPLSVLIKHRTQLSWTQELSLKLEHYKHRLLALLKLSPKNLFLERFPPPVRTDSMVNSKTVLIPSCLTIEDTSVFVKNCKVHNSTVGGALGATLALAIRNLLDSTGSLDQITIGLPINIRSGCNPVVSNQDFGFYVGVIFILLSIPGEIPVSIDDYFWELARKMSAEIKRKISKDEQYYLHRKAKYRDFCTTDYWESGKKDVSDAGRYPNFELSNVGNYDLDKQRVYKITETYSGVAQDIWGPVMSVIVMTVSGKLCWNVSYSTRAVREEVAKNYSEQILKLIKDIGCSQKVFN